MNLCERIIFLLVSFRERGRVGVGWGVGWGVGLGALLYGCRGNIIFF